MDSESKSYFLSNLQDYDKLIDEKESKLENIKETIKDLEEKKPKETQEKVESQRVDPGALESLGSPDLQDGNLLKTMREIQDKFKLHKESTITEFISNHPENPIQTAVYQLCQKVLSTFTFDFLYELELTSETEKWDKVLQKLDQSTIDFLKQNHITDMSFSEGKIYLEEESKRNDPYIYVVVGEKDANFNLLNRRIITKYDQSIYMGMIICYQNKLYDYSLR